jgi:uncharacterized HhH-GPD family protein
MADAALHFTGEPEADTFLASDPLALLVGFALDQQVTVQKAFSGPLELRRRLGSFDARTIAEMDPAALEEVFREKPAIHRFPGSMAGRVQELCAALVEEYDGHAERVWTEAESGADLKRRLLALPGIGEMKATSIVAVLARRMDVQPPGWEDVAPKHPCLADVDSPEALEAYQAAKRAYKASLRAAKASAG